MNKENSTYYLFYTRRIVAFIFMLFILLKPTVSVFSMYDSNVYEFVDSYDEKDNSSEKESSKDVGDENLHFYIDKFDIVLIKEIKLAKNYKNQINYFNYYLDIFLPPPEFLLRSPISSLNSFFEEFSINFFKTSFVRIKHTSKNNNLV